MNSSSLRSSFRFTRYGLRPLAFFIFWGGIYFGTQSALMASISLDPDVQRITVEPGRKATGFINVTNTTASKIRIAVQPEDWSDQTRSKNIPWLKVSPRNFTLGPGKSKKVKFQARLPRSQKTRYVSQVFFAFKNSTKNNLDLGMRIASLLYFNVEDKTAD